MLPEIKVYKINYDFIINNYLDQSLWKKEWNVFVYKDLVFTLNLRSIDVYDDSISFNVKINGLSGYSRTIWYYTKNSNVNVLKKQIAGTIFDLMVDYEASAIRRTPEYIKFNETENEERERLTEIAEGYLDDKGIDDEDIREAYIDKYLDKNMRVDVMRNQYLSSWRYNMYPEMFLMFTKVMNDDTRWNNVVRAIRDKLKIREIEKQLDEFLEEFNNGEYYDTMKEELEDI